MIAAIVLAAGASRRLGQPKQLVLHGGRPLVCLACETALAAGYTDVIVITGAHDDRVARAVGTLAVRCVYNPRFATGMASSIVAGITAAGDAAGALVMAVDQPDITATHLRALSRNGGLTATAYDGTRGIPAYFPRRCFAALRQLNGDRGAKALLHDAAIVDCPAATLDIDTPDDLRRLVATPRTQRR